MAGAPAPRTLDNIELEWPYSGPLLSISRYRCRVDHERPAGEQQQPWHVIGFPHRGAFVHHHEGRSTVVGPTDLLFLNAGAPYRTSHPFGIGDSGSALVLRRDLLLDAVAVHRPEVRDREDRPFPRPLAPSGAAVYLAQRLLTRQSAVAAADELAVTEAGLALAGEAIASAFRVWPRREPAAAGTRAGRRAADRVEAVRHELARRYDQPLRLPELAALAGISVYHLCRSFRARTGLTIHRYRNRLRLRAGLERLSDPRVDLTALALDLGFSSHSHFTAAFRTEFGLAPSRLRDGGLGPREAKARLEPAPTATS